MEENILTHYGVKGMKWGVRKEYIPHSKKKQGAKSQIDKKKLARNIAIGVTAVAAVIGVYGTYRFVKGVRSQDLEIAIEKGKAFAKHMKEADIATQKKYGFGLKPDSFYDKYVNESITKAKAHTFKEAYESVKPVREKAKEQSKKYKNILKDVKKTARELKTGKAMMVGGLDALELARRHYPEALKEAGIIFKDGHFYQKGVKLR